MSAENMHTDQWRQHRESDMTDIEGTETPAEVEPTDEPTEGETEEATEVVEEGEEEAAPA